MSTPGSISVSADDQHFYGTSDNAVKTQVWIAICTYVLVAIVRKELRLEMSLSQILQILSVNVFEQVPLRELVAQTQRQNNHTQANLENGSDDAAAEGVCTPPADGSPPTPFSSLTTAVKPHYVHSHRFERPANVVSSASRRSSKRCMK